ncbi:MAG: hypothetical protein KGQ36_05335 [Rickettsiales bacterium]|nr:hypothetical protein [Rickettsiales bacterium]
MILVIGILIAGVIEGRNLLQKSSLNSARALTKSSPVGSIKDLLLWYETSLEESFPSNTKDGTTITTWYDINPQSTAIKNNATPYISSTSTFTENVFGGIPGVFLKCDAYPVSYCSSLKHDSTSLVGSPFTIFVVEKKLLYPISGDLPNVSGYIISGAGNTSYQSLALSYNTSTGAVSAGLRGQITNAYSNVEVSNLVPVMHTIMLNSSYLTKYWANGGVSADSTKSGTTFLQNNPSNIVRIGNYFYNDERYAYTGYIAEYIVYTRALKDEERQAVEKYLSQKYNITITK